MVCYPAGSCRQKLGILWSQWLPTYFSGARSQMGGLSSQPANNIKSGDDLLSLSVCIEW